MKFAKMTVHCAHCGKELKETPNPPYWSCNCQEVKMSDPDEIKRIEYMSSPTPAEVAAREIREVMTREAQTMLDAVKKDYRDKARVQIAAALVGGLATRYSLAEDDDRNPNIISWAKIWEMADEMLDAGGY